MLSFFLHVGLLCLKHSREERPTMIVVVVVLESIREVLIENLVTSRGLKQIISNLLSNSNTTSIDALASNDKCFLHFSLSSQNNFFFSIVIILTMEIFFVL